MSDYTIHIASVTGWSESFIQRQLPLVRGLSYQHSALLLSGVETVEREDSMFDTMEQIRSELEE